MPRFTVSLRTAYGEIGPETIEAEDLLEAMRAARQFGEGLADGVLRPVRCRRGWHVLLGDETGAGLGAVLLVGAGPPVGASQRAAGPRSQRPAVSEGGPGPRRRPSGDEAAAGARTAPASPGPPAPSG